MVRLARGLLGLSLVASASAFDLASLMNGGGDAGVADNMITAALGSSQSEDEVAAAMMGGSGSTGGDADLDISSLMNEGASTAGSAHDAINAALMAGASTDETHSALTNSLGASDPTTFGSYDASGIIGSGTCMGGFVKDLDLYMDCTKLLGFLAVVNTEETDLDKLSKLEMIEWLKSMKGPSGNGLVIANNTLLEQINGLDKLSVVSGGLVIEGNPKLSSTLGLGENLKQVGINDNGESVVIKHNELLNDLGRSWDFWQGKIAGTLTIEENAMLSQIKGLGGVFTIGGGLVVSGNDNLADLDGLGSVHTVGADSARKSLYIVNNHNLKSIADLKDLQGALSGAIDISGNANLLTLDGLNKVLHIGKDTKGVSINIADNAQLSDLSGLSNVQGKVDGSIVVMLNPQLHVLAGLQKISEVGADASGNSLVVLQNDALVNLMGFSGIQSVAGAVSVEKNPSLETLDGLQNIKALSGKNMRGNSLEVVMNEKLTNLDSLRNLQGHLNGILVKGNPALHDVTSLEQGVSGATSVTIQDVQCVSSSEVGFIKSLVGDGTATVQDATTSASCVQLKRVGGGTEHTQVGTGAGSICGGTTSHSTWNTWDMFGSTGLYVDVDTSKCAFTEARPRYVASVVGDTAHWQLTGVNSIYSATNSGFRVYMWHPVLRGKFMQYFAQRYNWKLSWLADSGKSSGITEAGKSGWAQVPKTKNALFIDVSTEKSQYASTPRLVTSIHGGRDHWKLQGAHSIYEPSPKGFRIFCVFPTEVTAAFAEEQKWQVAWVGSEDERTSGLSSTNWMAYTPTGRTEGKGLFVDVDTSAGKYATVPSYVTSLTGRSHHWMVTGAGAIYDATKTSLRVYLDKAQESSASVAQDWRVNYIAYSDPVDCINSEWGSWSSCSLTCGTGTQRRTRGIAKRAYYGGKCLGALADDRDCSPAPCPVDCVMTQWTAFSACNVNCGMGSHTRSRSITTAAASGGIACATKVQQQACDAGPCPVHCKTTSWGSWTSCTKSCGGGVQTRTRSVTTHTKHGGFQCPTLAAKQECNTHECPSDCQVSDWGQWGACSVTCGWGSKTRARHLLRDATYGGKKCPLKSEQMPCHEFHCPVHCSVSAWGTWADCTRSCGRGSHSRSRTVLEHAQSGGYTCPELTNERECNVDPCPVNCIVSHWMGWRECSKSCGGGVQVRKRIVLQPRAHDGVGCPLLEEQQSCNNASCAVDCVVRSWSTWSSCSLSCGTGGSRTRSRRIDVAVQHGGKPCPGVSESASCDLGPCPLHCQTSGWTVWSACTHSCGTGMQKRTREITIRAEFGGYQCPALSEDRQCNPQECPVDCAQTAFGFWSDCTRTCNSGFQSRTRAVQRSPRHGGKACAHSHERRACATEACPVDCVMAHWSAWGECSATCGEGTWVRSRGVMYNPMHGGAVCGARLESGPCNEGPCPIHCTVSAWTPWGTCTKTCGGGSHRRTREVTNHARHGGFSCPSLEEEQDCNTEACAVDCQLSSWGGWGPCSTTCGGGLAKRLRNIVVNVAHGGAACGATRNSKSCNTQYCPVNCVMSPWSDWSSCTKTCADGEQTRARFAAIETAFGGRACSHKDETRDCNDRPCPTHCTVSVWSTWTACTLTCGLGNQRRERTVTSHAQHGGYTCPALDQSRACNEAPCAIDCTVGTWGTWAPYLRGGSKLRRMRTVSTPRQFGGKVCPHRIEYKVWHADANCKGGMFYGKWSQCSKECGSGFRYRYREHVKCSDTAVVKFHTRFRQGERCNTQDCGDGSSGSSRAVIVPQINYPEGSAALSSFRTTASAATLDEELGERQIF